MKLVVCDAESIPPWIFPDAMPNFPNPGIAVDTPALAGTDFVALVRALGSSISIDEPLVLRNSFCDVGFTHDAPDCVPCVRQELLDALIAVPAHERWRVAELWAEYRAGRRANKEELAIHKKLLNTLCDCAAFAVANQHVAALVEPYA